MTQPLNLKVKINIKVYFLLISFVFLPFFSFVGSYIDEIKFCNGLVFSHFLPQVKDRINPE